MSNFSDFFGASNLKRWVSGTTYALDTDVWSPVSGHTYRRIVAGAGTTDPSADQTNWKILGAAGVKSIQRGVLTIGGVTNTGTATISSVNMARTELRLLGMSSNGRSFPGAVSDTLIRLVLTNATTITALAGSSGAGFLEVSWELTEFWA